MVTGVPGVGVVGGTGAEVCAGACVTLGLPVVGLLGVEDEAGVLVCAGVCVTAGAPDVGFGVAVGAAVCDGVCVTAGVPANGVAVGPVCGGACVTAGVVLLIVMGAAVCTGVCWGTTGIALGRRGGRPATMDMPVGLGVVVVGLPGAGGDHGPLLLVGSWIGKMGGRLTWMAGLGLLPGDVRGTPGHLQKAGVQCHWDLEAASLSQNI